MTPSSGGSGGSDSALQPSPAPSRSRRRNLAIVAGGLVMLLVLAEVLLRIFFYAPAAEQIYTSYGWVKAPGSKIVHSDEGFSSARVNSLGLYDDEILAERPPLRAVLLGDSYGEALQVARSRNFSSVLEQDVPGLEVINFAQSGRTPVSYAAYLPRIYGMFEPDVVIVQINDGDIGDLRDSGFLGRDPEEVLKSFLEYEPHALELRGRASIAQWLAEHSALATFMYRRFTILSRSEKKRLENKFRPAGETSGRDTLGTVDPRIGALMDGFDAHMRRVTGHIIYVYIPSVIYSDGECKAKFPERREFYHEFARRNGVKLVDAFDAFCRDYETTGRPLHGFQNSRLGAGHINAEGHRVVGDLLAQAVEEMMASRGAAEDSTR